MKNMVVGYVKGEMNMNMPTWMALHPAVTVEHLGLIPHMLSADDPRPAKEQFDERYAHGGGWSPFKGFKLLPNGNLQYPGDPPTRAIARAKLREETITLYEHSWVSIVQPDGSFEVCRMD